MAAKPEVLIISLLQNDKNVVPKPKCRYRALAACTRHRPTACDTIVCRISKMADNNRKWSETQLFHRLLSSLQIQNRLMHIRPRPTMALATSSVKSNYFRFATISLCQSGLFLAKFWRANMRRSDASDFDYECRRCSTRVGKDRPTVAMAFSAEPRLTNGFHEFMYTLQPLPTISTRAETTSDRH